MKLLSRPLPIIYTIIIVRVGQQTSFGQFFPDVPEGANQPTQVVSFMNGLNSSDGSGH
jgi:hypothetical protein